MQYISVNSGHEQAIVLVTGMHIFYALRASI